MGRPRIASGYWGTATQVAAAKRKALQQIQNRRRNEVSLYIGVDPLEAALKVAEDGRSVGNGNGTLEDLLERQWQLRQRLSILHRLEVQKRELQGFRSKGRLYLPDMQRGTFVCGAPGSGKTFSIIDPLLRSAIEQGFPTVLYDFKYPGQAAILAPYATMLGYEVYIFAPGFEESESVNILDFLRSPIDAEMSGQIASVMNKNFNLGGKEDDPFFSNAAMQLLQAIFMLAKATPDPDLITCQALLSLPELVKRLELWQKRNEQEDRQRLREQNPDWEHYAIPKYEKDWVMANFGQIISVGKSEKTLSSIIGVANNNLTRFMKPNIARHFTGKSTFDFWLEGRKLLVIGLDRVRRDTIGPLVATALHMIVSYNLTLKRRNEPLIVAMDELPTLYLPNIQNWLNENRSDGFCGIIGLQNMNQLEKTYGKEMSRAIITGCTTKAIFNPGEPESAEFFSKILGEEEIVYKSKSLSSGKGGRSTSTSEQDKTRKLLETSQFLKMPAGTCVLISPGFVKSKNGREEANIPILQPIKISQPEIKFQKYLESQWEKFLINYCRNRQRLVPESLLPQVQKDFDTRLDEIFQRKKAILELLDWQNNKPLPPLYKLANEFIHLDHDILISRLQNKILNLYGKEKAEIVTQTLRQAAQLLPKRERKFNFDLSSRLDFANCLLPAPPPPPPRS